MTESVVLASDSGITAAAFDETLAERSTDARSAALSPNLETVDP
ncbi:hypothetical protein [Halopelagius fulvigenes]|uniref:Uncharacterized protein n=1 Tax=Halopelagius fulvigenes TaxID=1198324 RepID=A0ABD5U0E5_9EURY